MIDHWLMSLHVPMPPRGDGRSPPIRAASAAPGSVERRDPTRSRWSHLARNSAFVDPRNPAAESASATSPHGRRAVRARRNQSFCAIFSFSGLASKILNHTARSPGAGGFRPPLPTLKYRCPRLSAGASPSAFDGAPGFSFFPAPPPNYLNWPSVFDVARGKVAQRPRCVRRSLRLPLPKSPSSLPPRKPRSRACDRLSSQDHRGATSRARSTTASGSDGPSMPGPGRAVSDLRRARPRSAARAAHSRYTKHRAAPLTEADPPTPTKRRNSPGPPLLEPLCLGELRGSATKTQSALLARDCASSVLPLPLQHRTKPRLSAAPGGGPALPNTNPNGRPSLCRSQSAR